MSVMALSQTSVNIIRRKKDGHPLPRHEIEHFVSCIVEKNIQEAQLGKWINIIAPDKRGIRYRIYIKYLVTLPYLSLNFEFLDYV